LRLGESKAAFRRVFFFQIVDAGRERCSERERQGPRLLIREAASGTIFDIFADQLLQRIIKGEPTWQKSRQK
jgi:hypothetical protein